MKVLKIENKEYPVLPGWAALKMFGSKRGMEFHELFEYLRGLDFNKPTNQFLDDMALLAFCFIERGCHKHDKINDLTLDDLIDWIGKEMRLNEIIALLFDSYGVEVSNPEKAVKKKTGQK